MFGSTSLYRTKLASSPREKMHTVGARYRVHYIPLHGHVECGGHGDRRVGGVRALSEQ